MLLRNTIQPLERWIDQFQFAGRRPMSIEERDFLNSQLLDSSKPFNCIAIGFCSLASLSLFALSGLGLISNDFFGPLLAISLIFTAIVPLQWKQQMRTYRENLADIQVGEVEIFRTAPSAPAESWIVFLPRSGRLLSRQGDFVRRRTYLKVHGIALRPRETVKPFPSQFALEENHLTPVRILSNLEKKELALLLPKDHSWKWLLPTILWAWTLIGIDFMAQGGFSYSNIGRTVLLAVAAIALTIYYGFRHRRLQTVKNDLQRGTVICGQMGSYNFEHLIKSDLLWTVDSTPASWRKRTSSSWLCPTI